MEDGKRVATARMNSLYLAWLVALISTLGVLFVGEVMGRTPCVLCWYQRIAMFPLAVILAIACYLSDDSVRPAAGMAEIHTMTNENGVMRMHPAGPQEIPPDGRLVLKPGGLHVMLMQLREPLVKGGTVSLELTFERAGTVTVDAPILGPGATQPPE